MIGGVSDEGQTREFSVRVGRLAPVVDLAVVADQAGVEIVGREERKHLLSIDVHVTVAGTVEHLDLFADMVKGQTHLDSRGTQTS